MAPMAIREESDMGRPRRTSRRRAPRAHTKASRAWDTDHEVYGTAPPSVNRDRARSRLTVLYDADCGVCRLTIAALGRLDWWRHLDFAPLQTYEVEPEPSREELLAALHARDASGRWFRGGAAALRIASAVPVLVPLAIVGRLPGMGRLADRAYRLVADHRHVVSRLLDLDRCALDLRATPTAVAAETAEPAAVYPM